jgi:hypothetical protein
MDIAVIYFGTNQIGIFLGCGNYSFIDHLTYSIGSSPYSIAAGDFNNDIYIDLVVSNFENNSVGIWLGYGNGSFANQTTYLTGTSTKFVAVQDFNNDNLLDIIVIIDNTNTVGIFLGYGDGTFSNLKTFSIGYGSLPFSLVGGDFNNDRKLDLVVANNGTSSLQILLQIC